MRLAVRRARGRGGVGSRGQLSNPAPHERLRALPSDRGGGSLRRLPAGRLPVRRAAVRDRHLLLARGGGAGDGRGAAGRSRPAVALAPDAALPAAARRQPGAAAGHHRQLRTGLTARRGRPLRRLVPAVPGRLDRRLGLPDPAPRPHQPPEPSDDPHLPDPDGRFRAAVRRLLRTGLQRRSRRALQPGRRRHGGARAGQRDHRPGGAAAGHPDGAGAGGVRHGAAGGRGHAVHRRRAPPRGVHRGRPGVEPRAVPAAGLRAGAAARRK